MEKKINLTVKEVDKKQRIDIFINNNEKNLSRNRIKNLILDGKLRINKKIHKDPSKKISAGDVLQLIIPEPKKLL